VVVSSSTLVDVGAAVVEDDVATVESRAAVALDVVVGTGASGHLFLHSPIILKGSSHQIRMGGESTTIIYIIPASELFL
jgi:hypothetical protein